MVQTRSLIIYGPHLYPTKLSKLLHDVTPVSSSAVVVTSAFLSFIPGIPYVEPCYTSCIIQSYNDEGDWRGSVGEKKGKGVEDERDSEEYRRWIWERCCPGTDYEGNLPHPLEGMVYELDLESFDILLSRLLSASPSAPYSLIPVDYIPFENGDSDKPTSAPKQGEILVFSPTLNITNLQPTQEYFALILRGAFFTPLTRTYLSHLFLIQPYAPKSPGKRIMRRLIQLTMLPQFLLFWLPSRIKGLGWWYDRVGVRFGGWGLGIGIERLVSRWVGSGWRND